MGDDLSLHSEFPITIDSVTRVFRIEIDIYGKERYFYEDNLVSEFDGVGAGSSRARDIQLDGHVLRVEYQFKEGLYRSVALLDGEVIKDPVFEMMDEVNRVGLSSRKWTFLKYAIFAACILLLVLYFI